MTANADDFVEKRAALQEKSANIMADLGKRALIRKGLGSSAAQIGEGLKGLLTTPNLLIGGSLLGIGALGTPTLEHLGRKIRENFTPSLYDRMAMDETAATEFAKSVGKETGKKTVGLLGDLLSKALNIPGSIMKGRAQQSIFDQLQQEDEVLSQADPQMLQDAYHTMARFAPTLATDSNAVKTFLRESTLYGTGPNFMNIKQLADAERAVSPAQMMIKAKD